MEMVKQKVEEAAPYPLLKIKMGKDNDEDDLFFAGRSQCHQQNAAGRRQTKGGRRKNLLCARSNGWRRMESIWSNNRCRLTCGRDRLGESARLHSHHADESVKIQQRYSQTGRGFDGINIKVDQAGGLQESCVMIWMARSLGHEDHARLYGLPVRSHHRRGAFVAVDRFSRSGRQPAVGRRSFRWRQGQGWVAAAAGPAGLGVEGEFLIEPNGF